VSTKMRSDERVHLHSGRRGRTKLDRIMVELRDETFNISARTMRRWLGHYLDYGETPAYTKRLRRTGGSRTWIADDIGILFDIVMNDPALFLDEIRTGLLFRTGKGINSSSIHKKSSRCIAKITSR